MSTERIRELNDAFRKSLIGGGTVFSQGVAALPAEDRRAILDQVRSFDAFTPDNDPYGEHDFGFINFRGEGIAWKIDYYSRALDAGSDDPADSAKTTRVLTVMLASEL